MLGGSSWLRVSSLSRPMVVLVRVKWLRGDHSYCFVVDRSSFLVGDWYWERVAWGRSRSGLCFSGRSVVGTNRWQSGVVDVLEALGDFGFRVVINLVSIDVGHGATFLACLGHLELQAEASGVACVVVVREGWPSIKV